MATKTKAPTQAQILTQINERLGAIQEAVSTGFVPPAPPPVAVDEFPFWKRPADDLTVPPMGPSGFTMGRDGYLKTVFDPAEVRERALYCIGYQGNRVYYAEPFLTRVWADVATICTKAADPTNGYAAYRTYRRGLLDGVDPEVAIVATLTGEIQLWSSGPHPALQYRTLEALLKERSGANAGQGPSGE